MSRSVVSCRCRVAARPTVVTKKYMCCNKGRTFAEMGVWLNHCHQHIGTIRVLSALVLILAAFCSLAGTENPPEKLHAAPALLCYFSLDGVPYSPPLPPAINVSLCSHIILLGSNAANGVVIPARPEDVELYYNKVQLMKQLNPSLKVILSNGCEFGPLLATDASRKRFAESVPPLLRKYGFDGFDLDWEFPAWGEYRHLPQQRENFTLIIQEFRSVFEAEARLSGLPRLSISAAVASTRSLLDVCYDIKGLAKYIDFINLMTYDIHGFGLTTPFTGFNSPLHSGQTILDRTIFHDYNLAWAATEWVRRGMNASQVMVGMPTYAHTFILADTALHGLYDPAIGVSPLGDEVSYPAVCTFLQNTSTVAVWDDDCVVPYLFNDKLWISFDNETSVVAKARFILSSGFGGIMTYSLNSDDFMAKCDGVTRWPLHLAIRNAIATYSGL